MDEIDKVVKILGSVKDEQYLLLGAKEYDLFKSRRKEIAGLKEYEKAKGLLVGEVDSPSYLQLGKITMFVKDQRIKAGIIANDGKFFRIVSDNYLVGTKKPRNPEWFKELQVNV